MMINVVDLFAGPGGLSLGLEMVKDRNGNKVFNTICAVEKDSWACKTLKRNFQKSVVIEGDICDENTKKKLLKKCRGRTDIVVGGPPCQSFSLIGPRSGNSNGEKDASKYENLYMEFIDVVEKLKPKFVIFENVKGILSKTNGDEKITDVIVSELSSLGYGFSSKSEEYKNGYVVLNAADYGVPQTRERVFIIGNNIGVDNPVPEKTHRKPKRGRPSCTGLLPYVTLRDAIMDLPKLKAKKTITHVPDERIAEIERYNKTVNSGKEIVKYDKEYKRKHLEGLGVSGENFFTIVRKTAHAYLTGHMARSQMETDIKLFRGMRQGMTAKDVIESENPKIKSLAEYIRYDMGSFRDKYKKQYWNRTCSTIFAHLQKDGNRFIHPDSHQARTITPREAARIQSFPDTFYFEGPMTKKFQQIGNAVPPLLAMKIAESISSMIFSIR